MYAPQGGGGGVAPPLTGMVRRKEKRKEKEKTRIKERRRGKVRGKDEEEDRTSKM